MIRAKTEKRLDDFFHNADGTWALTGRGGAKSELDNEPSVNVPWLYNYSVSGAIEAPLRTFFGVHIVGEGATELVHIGQAVLNLKGTVEYFVENTFNYPTLAEAYKIAGLDAWNRLGEGVPEQHEPQQEAAQ